MKKTHKLLLFDLDGTLVFSGGAASRAFNRIFQKLYELDHAFEGIDGRGKTDPAIVRDIFVKKLKREPSKTEMKRFFKFYPAILRDEVKISSGYREIDGIKSFLPIVSKLPGVFMALGTGNVEPGAYIKLSRARLGRYFPVGGFGTDSESRPQLLKSAWQKAKRHYKTAFAKKDVFVIGDTPLDVNAGRACGFKTVGLACGMYAKKEVLASKPDFFFDDFKEPRAWIETLGL